MIAATELREKKYIEEINMINSNLAILNREKIGYFKEVSVVKHKNEKLKAKNTALK